MFIHVGGGREKFIHIVKKRGKSLFTLVEREKKSLFTLLKREKNDSHW